jgi:hypothetical protein
MTRLDPDDRRLLAVIAMATSFLAVVVAAWIVYAVVKVIASAL